MNTSKYNKNDLGGVIALLKDAANAVCPTEYYLTAESFFVVGTEEQMPDKSGLSVESAAAKKLNTLLNRAHTVVAKQDGAILGLASMDGQGNIGLLYAVGNEYKRTVKLLIRALERRAEKKQVSDIFVVSRESALKIFKECGYLPSENAGKSLDGDGQTPLSKAIAEDVAPVEFLPQNARLITLDGRKPIVAEGTVYIFPLLFFGISCFFAAILLLIVLIAESGGKVEGYENLTLFIVIVGVMFGVSLAVFVADKVRLKILKKKILAGWITNGVITEFFSESHWKYRGSGNSGEASRYVIVYLTYVFYDGNMNLRTVKFSHKYQGRALDFYRGKDVIVAYSGGVSYLLSRCTVIKDQEAISD